MMNLYRNLYFTPRFFLVWGVVALVFLSSFFLAPLLLLGQAFTFALLFLMMVDLIFLYMTGGKVLAVRVSGKMMSNGDVNRIGLHVQSLYRFPIRLKIIDEVPEQFQRRDFFLLRRLRPLSKDRYYYELRPCERGEYYFGSIHCFVTSMLGLIQRRFTSQQEEMLKVYPSYLQLKRFQLHTMPDRKSESIGQRKFLKGASTEFDHIKEYTAGDDIRIINWKASARKNEWMVNTYMDEKSQQVFCILDKGRLMKMPFDQLTLLDHSIHAALMFSHVALQKDDKVGLITFAEKVQDILPPSKNKKQFNAIMELLYKQQSNFLESNFENVYRAMSRKGGQRSLIMLFTNFESYSGFERQLPVFKAMNKKHVLCIIFFENTEVSQLAKRQAESLEEVYKQVIAEKFLYEKKRIVRELQKHGILSIYTKPENLTVNTVNRYLDLKARQYI